MPATFSKYLTSQRGGEQLLDSDGFVYSARTRLPQPLGDAASTPCPPSSALQLADCIYPITPSPSAPRRTITRKAVDQQLSVTQNIVSEAIA